MQPSDTVINRVCIVTTRWLVAAQSHNTQLRSDKNALLSQDRNNKRDLMPLDDTAIPYPLEWEYLCSPLACEARNIRSNVIQIKIWAEYLVSKAKVGLSGVLDKPDEAFGTMSRYSAKMLICVYRIHFSIFNAYVGVLRTLHFRTGTVPSAIVHCHPSEEWGCSSDNQISQHALHGRRCSKAKKLSGTYTPKLVKLRDKLDAIHINRKFFSTGATWIEVFFHTCNFHK